MDVTPICIKKFRIMPSGHVVYYTFLDACMDYYTSINTNFIELTHKYQYFVLVSGTKDDQPYADFLRTILGPHTIYIESDQNKMTRKFNLFREYLIANQDTYKNSVFCKIDTDLVHYRSQEFQAIMRHLFNYDQRLFVGIQGWGKYLRGGLNAIHYQSIVNLLPLPEDHDPFEFDVIFSSQLQKQNLVNIYTFPTFEQDGQIAKKYFATHIISQRHNIKKVDQLKSLLQQLQVENITI